MNSSASAVLPNVVQSHADDASALWTSRAVLVRAPHVKLADLGRTDERIVAHLDGLSVAGQHGWSACEVLLEDPSAGELFVVTARLLDGSQANRLEQLLVAVQNPQLRRGLLAGFGWTARDRLRGTVADLLRSQDGLQRLVAVAACSMHRVDPGVDARAADRDPDPSVRARVLRAAGELGKQELVSLCGRAIHDEDAGCQFWAAWSAVVLGDRENGLAWLSAAAFGAGCFHARAFQLAMQASKVDAGHALLQTRAPDSANLRLVIKGAGYVGDPKYIPWLIGHMASAELARVAGESFSMITGLDLAQPPFELARPENFESGPTDDPEDESVAMDEDDGLPWPDQPSVQAWWNDRGARFTTGVRHFMGRPPSRDHCIDVLKTGYQRQRIAAAYHLCLLSPGTPLFEWRAPAWRQRRELAQMA